MLPREAAALTSLQRPCHKELSIFKREVCIIVIYGVVRIHDRILMLLRYLLLWCSICSAGCRIVISALVNPCCTFDIEQKLMSSTPCQLILQIICSAVLCVKLNLERQIAGIKLHSTEFSHLQMNKPQHLVMGRAWGMQRNASPSSWHFVLRL